LSYLLIIAGVLGLFYSLYYYISEVRCMPYSTMGVEMSFSYYWFLASAVFFSGICLYFQKSLLWAIAPTIIFYLLSFSLRTLLSNMYMGLDCKPTKKEGSGFKAFEEKIKKQTEDEK